MTSLLKAVAVAIAVVALAPAPASLFAQAAPPVVFGYNQIPAEAPLASRIGGTVLLNELGCVNCHAPGALGTVTGGKSGPDLRRSSALKPGFLEAWLAAPHEVKPGTTMPDLLATLPAAEREQTAADLAAYLRSLTSGGVKPAAAAAPDVAQGATLFHSVGCVACHSPAQPPPAEAMGPGAVAKAPEFPSVPYGRLGDKYTVETLADFLQHPHEWRPAGRMPSFALTAQEAASIAGWLMAKGTQTGAAIKAANRTGNVQAGKTHFQKLQCAACHDVGEGAAKPAAKALAQLKWDAAKSCVAATPAKGLPHYALSAKQAETIRAAATAGAPLEQRAAMQAQLASLNCTACHVRDTLGGPENGRALYFEGSGEDLGEEGRMPPRLTHAGYKIIPEALTEIIANGVKLRPYFKTRMPAFGKTLAPALAGAFEKCDLPKNFKTLDQKGRNEAGRKLVGTTGMSCIACHPLNGHKSLGISAVDLVKSMPRLRLEWFAEFLQNPAAFNPGTRMPSFWPDAKVAKIQADADAIRVYLMEADQARLPDGLTSSQSYELVPSQKPVIFRTFIEGAGTQGIAVGYPQGLNVAFDAETASWAMAWKGRFLDAEATWFERPNPPAVPLGTDVLKLMAAGAPLAHLENDQAPWPAPYGEASKVRYLGFRVDRAGVPTFRYRFDGAEVTDRIEAGNDGRSLTRVVEWTGGNGTTAVRLATGKTIEAKDATTWRVGGKWEVKVLMPANAKVAVRPTAGGKEQEAVLLLPAGTGANQVRYLMQW